MYWLQDKKVYLIECTQHISRITFILYAQSQKIRKLHNIKKTNSKCAFVDIGGIVDIFFSYKEQYIIPMPGYGIKGIHVWVIHFIQSWVKNIVKIYTFVYDKTKFVMFY